MAFVQGCTGDVSTQIAVEASRTRALLEARNRLSEARGQKEEMLENLRSEILRFATFFRHAVADDISHHDPTVGVYEAQRFDNWMKLNDTSVLPTFQDKVFLQSTHEAAVHVMRNSRANLSSDEAGMIKRLAVVEDAIPIADEYRRWKQVLAVVQRYAVLFNGVPTTLLVLLWAFVVPAAMAVIALALPAVLPRSALPPTVVDVLTVTLSVLSLGIALIGFVGPFARARIAVRLSQRIAGTERFVTARITSGRAMAVLVLIRQKLAALDPGFATRHEILPDQMLTPLRAEAAFLQAKLATRHLTTSRPIYGSSASTVNPDPLATDSQGL
jgi:hypothetical protein